jgi:hypothetical protein
MNLIAFSHAAFQFDRRPPAPTQERSAPSITSMYSRMKTYRTALRISTSTTPIYRYAARLFMLMAILTHGETSQIAIAGS